MLQVIDCIYVLKLLKNDKTELQKSLNELFPDKKVNFYEVEGKTVNKNEGSINMSIFKIINQDYTDDVALDITKNHIEMIKQAYNNNYQYVLFMEEDARIEKPSCKKLESVNQWLSNSKKWDIFYLGYCNYPLPVSFLVTSNIVKLWSPLNAHSYILNKRGMEKILNYTEYGKKNMNIHADKMFKQIPYFNKYGMYPMISFQKKDPALFTKACDKLNLRLSMKTVSKVIENLSIIVPILFLILITYLMMKLFFKV